MEKAVQFPCVGLLLLASKMIAITTRPHKRRRFETKPGQKPDVLI